MAENEKPNKFREISADSWNGDLGLLVKLIAQKPEFYLRKWALPSGDLFVVREVFLLLLRAYDEPKFRDYHKTIGEWIAKYLQNHMKSKPEEKRIIGNCSLLISRAEVENIFHQINASMSSFVVFPAVEYEKYLHDFQYATRQTQLPSVFGCYNFPSHAIIAIFLSFVIGINWKTNQCMKHPNCLLDTRQKVIEVMRRLWNASENGQMLIASAIVNEEVTKLREACYFCFRREIDDVDYFFESDGSDKTVPLTNYMEVVSKFQLPFDPFMTELVQKRSNVRAWVLGGWVMQFFVSDPELYDLRNAVLNEIQILLEPQFRGEMFDIIKTKFFAGHHTALKYMEYPFVEDAKILNLQRNLLPSNISTETRVDQIEDYSSVSNMCGELSVANKKLSFVYKQNEFVCTSTLLPASSSRRNFIVNKADYLGMIRNLVNRKAPPKKLLATLSDYMRNADTTRIVLRSIKCSSAEEYHRTRLFSDEVFEAIGAALESHGLHTKKRKKMLSELKTKLVSGEKHINNTMTFPEFNKYLEQFDIVKSWITIIPDVVQARNAARAMNSLTHQETVFNSNGDEVMYVCESVYFILKSLMIGVNWERVIREKGFELLKDFKKKLGDVLRPFYNKWKHCFINKKHITKVDEYLKSHGVLEGIPIKQVAAIENELESKSIITLAYVNSTCLAFDLETVLLRTYGQILPKWQAMIQFALTWLFVFFDCDQTTEDIPREDLKMIKACFCNCVVRKVSEEDRSTVLFFEVTSLFNKMEKRHYIQVDGEWWLQSTVGDDMEYATQLVKGLRSERESLELESIQKTRKKKRKTKKNREVKTISQEHSNSSEELEVQESASVEGENTVRIPITPELDLAPEDAESTVEVSEPVAISEKCFEISNDAQHVPIELQDKLEAAQAEIEKMRLEKAKSDSKLRELETQNEKLLNEVARMKQLEAENKEMFEWIEKRKDQDTKKVAEIKKKYEKAAQTIVEKEKEKKSMVDDLESKLRISKKNHKNTERCLRKTRENLDGHVAKWLEMEQEVDDMKRRCERMERERLQNASQMEIQIKNNLWESVQREHKAEERARAAESAYRSLVHERQEKNDFCAIDRYRRIQVNGYLQKLDYKQQEIERLQRNLEKANGNSPQSEEEDKKDVVRYCDQLQNIRLNLEHSVDMIELRERIKTLKSLTNYKKVKAIADNESAILEKTIAVTVGIITLNIMRAQHGVSLLECYPLPPYPTLSEKFEETVREQKNEPIFDKETECGICYELIQVPQSQMICPTENCSICFHGVCIKQWLEKKPVYPYCQEAFLDREKFPSLS